MRRAFSTATKSTLWWHTSRYSFHTTATALSSKKNKKAPPSPAEQLSRSIRAAASDNNVGEAVRLLQEAMLNSVSPTQQSAPSPGESAPPLTLRPSDVATTLFLCEKNNDTELGLQLIRHVMAMSPASSGVSNGSFEWDEKCLTVVLRILCKAGSLDRAINILKILINKGAIKLRSFSPILKLCNQKGKSQMLLHVLREGERHGLEFLDEDFKNIFECLSHSAASSSDLSPAESSSVLLESPEMRERLLALSEYEPVLSAETAEAMLEWMGAASLEGENSGTWNVNEAEVDSTTGKCSCCHTTLSGMEFTPAHRDQLLHDIKNVLVKERCKTQSAKTGFEAFMRYLHQITAHPSTTPTVVIDGANVGYIGVSRWAGHARQQLAEALRRRSATESLQRGGGIRRRSPDDVTSLPCPPDFAVIQAAVEECNKLGQRPLILLHERHGELHNQTDINATLFQEWRRAGIVYTTPAGLNDDICWLYAGVLLNSNARMKKKTYILSNDLMRDHHFHLLSKRSFVRWRDRYTVRFSCVRDHEAKRTNVVFEFPVPYSRSIQYHTHGQAGREETAGGAVVESWHIPVGQPHSKDAHTSKNRQARDDDGHDGDGQDAFATEEETEVPPVSWICISRIKQP